MPCRPPSCTPSTSGCSWRSGSSCWRRSCRLSSCEAMWATTTARRSCMVTEEAVAGTKAHILAAAEELIRDRGLMGATTRAIAERAGCAEGSIYRYFPDKHAIIHEIVRASFPEFLALVETLPDRAGTGTVRRNLEQIAVGALGFYRLILPIV